MRWVLVGGALLVACGSSTGGSGPVDGGGALGGGGSSGFGGSGATIATGGSTGCIPNQQVACACGAGEVGYQVCLPSGAGFSPCVCPDAGSGGSGGASGAGGCPSTMKYCSGVCVAPSPDVGCSLTDCMPCTAPPHSGAVCNGPACDFICDAGYAKSGVYCYPSGGGGAGGTGATGGLGGTGGTGGATCNAYTCPTPAPPAQKCCVTAYGPCGVDYGQGVGCQSALGGYGGTGAADAGICPPTQPANGTPCVYATSCSYGSVLCLCLSTWYCQ